MAKEMAEVIASRPGSEKHVKKYLKKATIGKGVAIQEIPFGLLDDELRFWEPEKHELVFYRGMRKDLQRMRQLSIKARDHLETIVQTLEKLVSSISRIYSGNKTD